MYIEGNSKWSRNMYKNRIATNAQPKDNIFKKYGKNYIKFLRKTRNYFFFFVNANSNLGFL